ncbi:hypothetical protein WISP_67463 [Willisornis vidua]|uniref:Uncharacterized protein n=1 Tax=Willisornis vidua TaxID=1566151 RepID=A0ABQ9D8L9_9PASS|nr:hypothetical protein WISP_67463 [Willisornis vidua]
MPADTVLFDYLSISGATFVRDRGKVMGDVSGRGGAARGSSRPRRELHPRLSLLIIIVIIVIIVIIIIITITIITIIPAAPGLGLAAALPHLDPELWLILGILSTV